MTIFTYTFGEKRINVMEGDSATISEGKREFLSEYK